MNASLSSALSQRIAVLHGQGFSDRWIARRLAVAAKTVQQTLREIRDRRAIPAVPARFSPGDPLLPTGDAPPGYDPTNVHRCRGCGALVYLWPCLACCLAAPVPPEATSTSC